MVAFVAKQALSVLILFTFISCNSVKGGFPLHPIHTLASVSRSGCTNNCHCATSPFGKSDIHKLPALRNLGHTCYLNAMLQTLFYSPYGLAVLAIPVSDKAMNQNLTFRLDSTGHVLHRLFRQFLEASSNDHFSILNPRELISTMGLDLGYQEDAHEFLLNLLQQVDDSLMSTTEISASMKPSAILLGKMEHSIESVDAHLSRQQASSFVTLGVDIASTSEAKVVNVDRDQPGGKDDDQNQSITLQDLLGQFLLSDELLTGANRLRVEIDPALAGELQVEDDVKPIFSYHDAIKRDRLMSPLPTMMFIHINRYSYDRDSGRVIKKHAPVSVPLALDMRPYVHSSSRLTSTTSYELSSVVVHLGDSAEHGHYIAFVRNISTSSYIAEEISNGAEWIAFEDSSRPRRVSWDDVVCAAETRGGAYMLGYTMLGQCPHYSVTQKSEL